MSQAYYQYYPIIYVEAFIIHYFPAEAYCIYMARNWTCMVNAILNQFIFKWQMLADILILA